MQKHLEDSLSRTSLFFSLLKLIRKGRSRKCKALCKDSCGGKSAVKMSPEIPSINVK